MPVVIDPLGIQRVRRTDAAPQVTVDGTGFSAANNSVFVSGSLAPPIAQSTTQITFNLPAPFTLGLLALRSIHVAVIVVNNDTGEKSDDAYVWIPGDIPEAADAPLDTAIPGPFEKTAAPERPRTREARDMQRLASLVEALTKQIPDGNVVAWDGAKLASPAGLKGSGGGQVLTVDVAEATNLFWRLKCDAFLPFGGSVSSGFFNPGRMIASGHAGLSLPQPALGTQNWALADGTLDLISLHGGSSGGGLLDRLRVLVNGLQVFDSGAGLATLDYRVVIAVAVLEGDRIETEVTCTVGIGAQWSGVGGIRLLID